MKSSTFQISVLLACVMLSGAARAEKADRDKPMHIESDTLRYEDTNQTSVFTGKVVLTKGTIVIRGARLDVRQFPDGSQFGVVKAEPGKLAFFRQKRDTKPGAVDEYMEGEGEVIEYDSKTDTVKFLQRAQMRRFIGSALNDEINGVVIVLDNTTSVMTVDGGAARPNADSPGPRVRAMLTPRVDESRPAGQPGAAATTPPAAPAAGLRRSNTLGADKK